MYELYEKGIIKTRTPIYNIDEKTQDTVNSRKPF